MDGLLVRDDPDDSGAAAIFFPNPRDGWEMPGKCVARKLCEMPVLPVAAAAAAAAMAATWLLVRPAGKPVPLALDIDAVIFIGMVAEEEEEEE